jgi:hypothetical protein
VQRCEALRRAQRRPGVAAEERPCRLWQAMLTRIVQRSRAFEITHLWVRVELEQPVHLERTLAVVVGAVAHVVQHSPLQAHLACRELRRISPDALQGMMDNREGLASRRLPRSCHRLKLCHWQVEWRWDTTAHPRAAKTGRRYLGKGGRRARSPLCRQDAWEQSGRVGTVRQQQLRECPMAAVKGPMERRSANGIGSARFGSSEMGGTAGGSRLHLHAEM